MEHAKTPPLTTPQAASLIGVKPATLEIWRVQGKGPRFLKLGRSVRYLREDLDEFMAAAVRRSTSDYGEAC